MSLIILYLMNVVRKGQALQFNWLFEKEAFILHSDDTFSVDFAKVKSLNFTSLWILLEKYKANFFFILKVEGAVESLSREILTIQARGDKEAASLLLQKYCKMTKPLTIALQKLENVQVRVKFCYLLVSIFSLLILIFIPN